MYIVTYLPFEWSIGLSIYPISGELQVRYLGETADIKTGTHYNLVKHSALDQVLKSLNFSIMNPTFEIKHATGTCVVSISLEILHRNVRRLENVFLKKKITRSSICRGILILGKDTTYTNGNVPSITTHVPSCKYSRKSTL